MLKIQKEALESGNEEEIRLLSDQNIGHIVHELFGGGIESTTMTILWFILYLIHNPQVREKKWFSLKQDYMYKKRISAMHCTRFKVDIPYYICKMQSILLFDFSVSSPTLSVRLKWYLNTFSTGLMIIMAFNQLKGYKR